LNEIKAWQDDGKETFCIPYPDLDNIPVIGCRIQLWCDACCHIYTQEFVYTEKQRLTLGKNFDELIEGEGRLQDCPQCKGELKDFEQALATGIDCPFCEERMDQKRWFSNEHEESDRSEEEEAIAAEEKAIAKEDEKELEEENEQE
jgi:hypothetical protein